MTIEFIITELQAQRGLEAILDAISKKHISGD